jgi:hypothetical protein
MNKNFSFFIIGLIGLLCLLTKTPCANAHLTVVESGELISIGEYRLTTETQLSRLGSGLTLNFHFDAPVDESSQIRFSTGFGGIDFFSSFSYKWIPFPDSTKQPAIGFKVDASYIKDGNLNTIVTRFIPLSSKKFKLELGDAIPYIALPIGVSASNSSSAYPSHLVIGSEFSPNSGQKVNFGSEVGVNLKDSNSYLSFFAVFYFDRTEGNRLK